jgi:hypothetical protein
MNALPSVRAELAERFIVNFRMPPRVLQTLLPVDWLIPAEVNGWAIASFCMLDLRKITVAPLPTVLGMTSISSARRYAVVDSTTNPPKPAVFVTERHTNSSFGAWFTGLGFSAAHPYVDSSISREGASTRLSVSGRDEGAMFDAIVRPASEPTSTVFDASSFAAFIADGVSSYGLSRHGTRLTRVDLHKTDADYEPLEVIEMGGPVVENWVRLGAVFDSAFRTSGGRYEWTYRGLTS